MATKGVVRNADNKRPLWKWWNENLKWIAMKRCENWRREIQEGEETKRLLSVNIDVTDYSTCRQTAEQCNKVLSCKFLGRVHIWDRSIPKNILNKFLSRVAVWPLESDKTLAAWNKLVTLSSKQSDNRTDWVVITYSGLLGHITYQLRMESQRSFIQC